ncbi:unnamed protein product [Rotaria sordida]|uniref:protein-tyrosine-phosphatase n=1 Tax=Rotaria sordida TaxID=392033 RepID=A0A815BCC0_9BILA|nr:unnamed protein product [Rotaria sordida]CAF1274275.1 unnamed protein product [Rotaria sordida]CAF3654906.1 unnamed protein product [Rotaria sordida]CAF3689323.1 unnamed protein product [Rotaria sordida]
MSTVVQPRISTNKRKKISSPSHLSLLSKSQTSTSSIRKPIDPFEQRLNHIRIHLLNNKIQRKITYHEPTLIFDKFLYLGGLKSLRDKNRLVHLNITHILSVLWIRPHKGSIPSNVKHLFIKAEDTFSFNMSPYFEQACQFIEDARQSNGRILVHCACGVSRSTTLCCAYLIKNHLMSIEQALTEIRSHRPIVQPNPSFLRQLIRFNEQIECDKAMINTIVEQLENV